MILQASDEVENNPISSIGYQVDIVTASDIELAWNDPDSTKDWVTAVRDYFWNPYEEAKINTLYVIGDANGCSEQAYTGDSSWDTCGSEEFPQWTAEDIWYINKGALISEAFPMIYTNHVPNDPKSSDWTSAAQWKRLAEYSHAEHVVTLFFAGELTQFGAGCDPSNDPLCATPENGYQRLYSTLNSDIVTSQELQWSSDIRWMP